MPATIEQSPVSQILSENPITLEKARHELAKVVGKRFDRATIRRWCLRGVRGVTCEHVRVGNMIMVSLPALTRFLEATTAKSRRA